MQFGCHIESGFHGKGFVRLYNYAVRYRIMVTEKALHRIRVLAFWERHGLGATMEAFSVKRRTLFLWKKKLKDGVGKPEVLNDGSRVPKKRRRRMWPKEVLCAGEFILSEALHDWETDQGLRWVEGLSGEENPA